MLSGITTTWAVNMTAHSVAKSTPKHRRTRYPALTIIKAKGIPA